MFLGAALEECYGAHLTIGPPLERGFYYDAYLGELKLSQENYTEVETAAKSLIKNAAPFQRLVVTKTEALQLFKVYIFIL
jgi:threonyl-tRNA synthetase